MQLDQPIPPPYPGGDAQYDFILNGNKKVKKGLLPSGNSRKQRLLLALAGGAVLLIILAIMLSFVLGSGGGATESLKTIAKTQTEIVRVSSDGSNQARSLTTQGFAQTVAVTITTSQQQTVAYLSSHNTPIKTKDLSLGMNSKTDASLKSAGEAGRYDEELTTILEQALKDYGAELNAAYKQATTKSQKELIQKLFDQVTILQKNQPATSS